MSKNLEDSGLKSIASEYDLFFIDIWGVVHNGIKLYENAVRALEELANNEKKSQVSENKKILFLSRINKKKGLDFLLEAWAKVSAEEWILQIAGNDDDGTINYIKERIKREDLRGRVELLGPLSEEQKKLAYTKAGLFILPSHSENFGIVVAEALSFGVPVLTTKGCPWQELETEKCGWWVEPTLEDIQEGLGKALSTPASQLKIMGESGRQLIEKKYQWEGIAARMQTFYQWLLSGGETPEFVV